MANSYDISTVVSRSYISEQLQDNMQKGAENRNAHFMEALQKQSEKKSSSVQKAEQSEDSAALKEALKREEERKKREKNKKDKKGQQQSSPSVKSSQIDLKA